VKCVLRCHNKKEIPPEDLALIRREVEIRKCISHENIARLHDMFEDDEYIYLVIEHLVGGDLFSRIVKKTVYEESEAKRVVAKLLGVIKYFHENGIVHRNIKPESIFLTSLDEDTSFKLADFSFVDRDDGRCALTGLCVSSLFAVFVFYLAGG
jgi:serine/threonine protein kinase